VPALTTSKWHSVDEYTSYPAGGYPAAVAPVEPRKSRSRIIVGLDQTTTARCALSWAFDAARLRHDCQLVVVVGWTLPSRYHSPLTDIYIPPGIDPATAAETWLQETLDSTQRTTDSVAVTSVVIRGRVDNTLSALSLDADLLVLGTRTSLLAPLRVHLMLRRVDCPVVVLPSSRKLVRRTTGRWWGKLRR
jgi:nucleotide-binding universal stress UspA family protein